jgi:hypothetical protein
MRDEPMAVTVAIRKASDFKYREIAVWHSLDDLLALKEREGHDIVIGEPYGDDAQISATVYDDYLE